MGTRNPAYTDNDLCHTSIPMRPVMSSYAKDTPITDPVLSNHHNATDHTYLAPEHTYLAPRIPGYNTDDVILQCKQDNVYDALGKYSDEHKVEAMKKRNLCYESTQVRRRPDERKSMRIHSGKKRNRCCLPVVLFLIGLISLGSLTVALLQYFGVLVWKGTNGNGAASVQTIMGKSTGSAISEERLKQLESNITALQQKIAPQEKEIELLKNSTRENENIISSLRKALESEQAKNRDLNKTVKSFEERLQTEERKSSAQNETLLQLRALHDALKNATTSSSRAQSANIVELDKRLDSVFSTMQVLNQTSRINNLQSLIAEESSFRQGNDTALIASINRNTLYQQQSVANLTAEISTVKAVSLQNINNLEARLNSSINAKVTRLQTDDQTLFSQVANVNQTFLQMMQNISLTPGPQGPAGAAGPVGAVGAVGPAGPVGPAGAGNLIGCREESDKTGGSGTSKALVVFLPYDNVTRVIVGTLCHGTVPAGVTLVDHSATTKQCTCTTLSNPGDAWECWLRIWTCPKTS